MASGSSSESAIVVADILAAAVPGLVVAGGWPAFEWLLKKTLLKKESNLNVYDLNILQ
jgi:hypothetical protein